MAIQVSIVEDDDKIRRMFGVLFDGTDGFRCLSNHATAEDALKRLPVEKVDVVLVDISLPGRSGIELVAALKAQKPKLRAVMWTVYEDSERLFQALLAGADGYLLKRTAPAELIECIFEVMEGGAPMSRPIATKVLQYFHRLSSAGSEMPKLTVRELEILRHLAAGMSYKEIAAVVNISRETVASHLKAVYKKLHVTSGREAAVKYARSGGLLAILTGGRRRASGSGG